MIDVERDLLVPVGKVAQERLGRGVTSMTIHRWVVTGIAGVKLEAVKMLGGWLTTPAAFAAFIKDRNAAALAPPPRPRGRRGAPAPIPPRSPEKESKLRKMGLLK
jgi:hypothetical protein